MCKMCSSVFSSTPCSLLLKVGVCLPVAFRNFAQRLLFGNLSVCDELEFDNWLSWLGLWAPCSDLGRSCKTLLPGIMLFSWLKCSLAAELDSYNHYVDWLILYTYVMFWQSHPPLEILVIKWIWSLTGRGVRGITQWWNSPSESRFRLQLRSQWASGCIGFLVTGNHWNTIVTLEMTGCIGNTA